MRDGVYVVFVALFGAEVCRRYEILSSGILSYFCWVYEVGCCLPIRNVACWSDG
jgi:hypothetical protein